MVHAEDNGELQCFADGFPLPNISWHKNGVIITNDSYSNIWIAESTLFRMNGLNRIQSHLNIERSDPSNTGNYTCTATNSYGSNRSTFNLIIQTGKLTLLMSSEFNSIQTDVRVF